MEKKKFDYEAFKKEALGETESSPHYSKSFRGGLEGELEAQLRKIRNRTARTAKERRQ